MRWLRKLFKGTDAGVSNGDHSSVTGGENSLHKPVKPVVKILSHLAVQIGCQISQNRPYPHYILIHTVFRNLS